MLSHIPRTVRWALAVAVIAAVGTAVFQSWRAESGAGGVPDGWVQTQSGPLGPGDRELLVKVRLAGLWEIPTGQEMLQRASSQRVREIGAKIAAEHTELDGLVRDTAAKLNVVVPNLPSEEQQGWMSDISSASGSDYDLVAVNRLRAAHGKVLPLVSQVRVGTRNELVRKLAVTTATFVGRHHEYLESTGLVDYSALPEPPAPASGQPALAGANPTGASLGVQMGTAAVVFFAAVFGIVGLLSLLRRGRRPRELAHSVVHVPEPRRPLAITPAPPERRPRHAARRW